MSNDLIVVIVFKTLTGKEIEIDIEPTDKVQYKILNGLQQMLKDEPAVDSKEH